MIPKTLNLTNYQYIYSELFEETLKNNLININQLTTFDVNGYEPSLVDDTRWGDKYLEIIIIILILRISIFDWFII